jgi:diaminopimelate epimerase
METASGVRRVRVTASSPAHSTVRVEVGRPEFRRGHIPAAGEGAELWDEPVEVSGRTFPGYGLSLGNPHLVLWFDAVESLLAHPIREFHPLSVNTALFPEGVNVHGALRAGPDELRMRTWERGSGETQACGSGSVAVFAVARRLGLVGGRATVHMPGGPVVMEENPDGLLVMTGPAEEVFSGVWEAGEG